MFLSRWLKLKSPPKRVRAALRPRQVRLQLEILEDRTTPSAGPGFDLPLPATSHYFSQLTPSNAADPGTPDTSPNADGYSVATPGTYTPNPTLTYHGGVLLTNVQVTTVFYAGYDATLRSQLDGFYTDITSSNYLTQLVGEYMQLVIPSAPVPSSAKMCKTPSPCPLPGAH